jgi:hypothetical protein
VFRVQGSGRFNIRHNIQLRYGVRPGVGLSVLEARGFCLGFGGSGLGFRGAGSLLSALQVLNVAQAKARNSALGHQFLRFGIFLAMYITVMYWQRNGYISESINSSMRTFSSKVFICVSRSLFYIQCQ